MTRRTAASTISRSLERRRRGELDIRPRTVVLAAGISRHAVRTRPGGPLIVIPGPERTYRPGAIVPAGSNSDIDPSEFLIDNSPVQGASEVLALVAVGLTTDPNPEGFSPIPPVPKLPLAGLWAAYYDPATDDLSMDRLTTAGAFVSANGGALSSDRVDPPLLAIEAAIMDKPKSAGAGSLALFEDSPAGIRVFDFAAGTRNFWPGDTGHIVIGSLLFHAGFLYWLEVKSVTPRTIRAFRDGGDLSAPTLIGEVAANPQGSGHDTQRLRLGSAGLEAVVKVSSPDAGLFHIQFPGTVTDLSPATSVVVGQGVPQHPAYGAGIYVTPVTGSGPWVDLVAAADPGDGASHWPDNLGWGETPTTNVALEASDDLGTVAAFRAAFTGDDVTALDFTVGEADGPFSLNPIINLTEADVPARFGTEPLRLGLRF